VFQQDAHQFHQDPGVLQQDARQPHQDLRQPQQDLHQQSGDVRTRSRERTFEQWEQQQEWHSQKECHSQQEQRQQHPEFWSAMSENFSARSEHRSYCTENTSANHHQPVRLHEPGRHASGTLPPLWTPEWHDGADGDHHGGVSGGKDRAMHSLGRGSEECRARTWVPSGGDVPTLPGARASALSGAPRETKGTPQGACANMPLCSLPGDVRGSSLSGVPRVKKIATQEACANRPLRSSPGGVQSSPPFSLAHGRTHGLTPRIGNQKPNTAVPVPNGVARYDASDKIYRKKNFELFVEQLRRVRADVPPVDVILSKDLALHNRIDIKDKQALYNLLVDYTGGLAATIVRRYQFEASGGGDGLAALLALQVHAISEGDDANIVFGEQLAAAHHEKEIDQTVDLSDDEDISVPDPDSEDSDVVADEVPSINMVVDPTTQIPGSSPLLALIGASPASPVCLTPESHPSVVKMPCCDDNPVTPDVVHSVMTMEGAAFEPMHVINGMEFKCELLPDGSDGVETNGSSAGVWIEDSVHPKPRLRQRQSVAQPLIDNYNTISRCPARSTTRAACGLDVDLVAEGALDGTAESLEVVNIAVDERQGEPLDVLSWQDVTPGQPHQGGVPLQQAPWESWESGSSPQEKSYDLAARQMEQEMEHEQKQDVRPAHPAQPPAEPPDGVMSIKMKQDARSAHPVRPPAEPPDDAARTNEKFAVNAGQGEPVDIFSRQNVPSGQLHRGGAALQREEAGLVRHGAAVIQTEQDACTVLHPARDPAAVDIFSLQSDVPSGQLHQGGALLQQEDAEPVRCHAAAIESEDKPWEVQTVVREVEDMPSEVDEISADACDDAVVYDSANNISMLDVNTVADFTDSDDIDAFNLGDMKKVDVWRVHPVRPPAEPPDVQPVVRVPAEPPDVQPVVRVPAELPDAPDGHAPSLERILLLENLASLITQYFVFIDHYCMEQPAGHLTMEPGAVEQLGTGNFLAIEPRAWDPGKHDLVHLAAKASMHGELLAIEQWLPVSRDIVTTCTQTWGENFDCLRFEMASNVLEKELWPTLAVALCVQRGLLTAIDLQKMAAMLETTRATRTSSAGGVLRQQELTDPRGRDGLIPTKLELTDSKYGDDILAYGFPSNSTLRATSNDSYITEMLPHRSVTSVSIQEDPVPRPLAPRMSNMPIFDTMLFSAASLGSIGINTDLLGRLPKSTKACMESSFARHNNSYLIEFYTELMARLLHQGGDPGEPGVLGDGGIIGVAAIWLQDETAQLTRDAVEQQHYFDISEQESSDENWFAVNELTQGKTDEYVSRSPRGAMQPSLLAAADEQSIKILSGDKFDGFTEMEKLGLVDAIGERRGELLDIVNLMKTMRKILDVDLTSFTVQNFVFVGDYNVNRLDNGGAGAEMYGGGDVGAEMETNEEEQSTEEESDTEDYVSGHTFTTIVTPDVFSSDKVFASDESDGDMPDLDSASETSDDSTAARGVWNYMDKLVMFSPASSTRRMLMDVSMEDHLPHDQPKDESILYMEAIGGLLWVAKCIRLDMLYMVNTSSRSTSGAVIFLEGNPIVFASTLQKLVVLSTAEAESMALAEGVKDVQYMLQLLGEIVEIRTPVVIHADRKGEKVRRKRVDLSPFQAHRQSLLLRAGAGAEQDRQNRVHPQRGQCHGLIHQGPALRQARGAGQDCTGNNHAHYR